MEMVCKCTVEGRKWDAGWKCYSQTERFPLLNDKTPSFRQRTQSINNMHACQADSKAPSLVPFSSLSSLPASIRDMSYWKYLRNIMKILSSFTKHVANSMSSSSSRILGFLGQYIDMSVSMIQQYTELKSKFLNSPDRFPLPLYSKTQDNGYITHSFPAWRPGTTKNIWLSIFQNVEDCLVSTKFYFDKQKFCFQDVPWELRIFFSCPSETKPKSSIDCKSNRLILNTMWLKFIIVLQWLSLLLFYLFTFVGFLPSHLKEKKNRKEHNKVET